LKFVKREIEKELLEEKDVFITFTVVMESWVYIWMCPNSTGHV
jgi:hypothetical protein